MTLNGSAPLGEALRPAVGVAGPKPEGKRAVVKVDQVHSAARGRDVDLVTVLPPGSTPCPSSVRGDDNYWHENTPCDDPMATLLEEVPRWLAERGLGPQPFACAGVSMGGFASPSRPSPRSPPGLLTSWPEMAKRKALANADQWASLDPLKHQAELGDVPVDLDRRQGPVHRRDAAVHQGEEARGRLDRARRARRPVLPTSRAGRDPVPGEARAEAGNLRV